MHKSPEHLLYVRKRFLLIVLLFVHQGIISERIDLGDFILHGNWTITAVYGHKVFHRTRALLFLFKK